ncbi:hypothetical protein [Ideonella sp. BN130291]|uniref:hypothetical protein n=1 Tax=Ideonella sp. BN130291 TaxID=3112940 RepID=UPI002E2598CC|nr:hypothetical protein [Ideonella sp. BN130291]
MKFAFLASALAALAGCATPAPVSVPDEALNPDVTPQTLERTICVPAYANQAQASATWREALKLQMMQRSGIEATMSPYYELDQVVPVELGGHPTHTVNLKLQEMEGEYGAKRKNVLERRLRLMVCDGKIGLREAQAEIYKDWQGAYRRYVNP